MSSRTISDTGIVTFSPLRTTVAVGAVTSFSLSTVRLERISWNMPMAILSSTISIKNSFSMPDWNTISAIATAKVSILKNVKMFDRKILR